MTEPAAQKTAQAVKASVSLARRRPLEGQLFLPKDTYRERRVVDAIRLWPILGVICFVLPIIWTGTGKSNVGAMGYLFSVWAVLILGGALLSRRLRGEAGAELSPEGEQASAGTFGEDAAP